MKFNSILLSASVAVGAALALAAPAGAQCQYSVIQWSPWQCVWEGTKSYSAAGLNDLGAWCGRRTACWPEESGLELKDLPIYCPPGGMPQVLPMPAGASTGGAQATAVNNSGVVVGFKYVGASDQYQQGVIWWPDGSVETIPPAKGASTSRANDINTQGVIVGSSGGLPYVLQDGVMTLIPGPDPNGGYALAVSSDGVVTGTYGGMADGRAFRWFEGKLEILPPYGSHLASEGRGVGRNGLIVGISRTFTGSAYISLPTIWRDADAETLPLLPGYTQGGCVGINELGVIIGSNSKPNPGGGNQVVRVIWVDGLVYALSDLLVPGSPSVGEVRRINQAGQMLTTGGPRLWSPTWHSPMDLNGDCAVNGSDLGVLLASWGAPDFDARCDFNGDGAVDGNDLGTLLGEWTVSP